MAEASSPPRPVERWKLPIWATGVTLTGLILALIGPFGTYLNGGLAMRAIYWIGSSWAGALLYGVGTTAVSRLLPARTLRTWLALAAMTLLVSIPETWITRSFALALWPRLAARGPGWIDWYAQTSLMGFSFTLIVVLLLRPARTVDGSGALPVAPPQPEPIEQDVIALQMEDHYVRVHTPAGSRLVLMPLTRAIESTDEEGLRTHRSWWVARRAVVRVEGTPRAMRLHLSNGLVAPVSRPAVAHLRAAGWIRD